MTTLPIQKSAGRKAGVLICDDHYLIRQALRQIIDRQPDMEVIGEAADGEEAVALACDLRPTAIMMDIEMPRLSGVEATQRIRRLLPEVIVVALTVHDSTEYLIGILEAGATGYITKSAMSADLPTVLRAAICGESILSNELLKKLIMYASQFLPTVNTTPIVSILTEKERHMLMMAGRGFSNKMIASSLDLTENTVKKYMKLLFDKLGVHSRTAAVTVAHKHGLLNSYDDNSLDEFY